MCWISVILKNMYTASLQDLDSCSHSVLIDASPHLLPSISEGYLLYSSILVWRNCLSGNRLGCQFLDTILKTFTAAGGEDAWRSGRQCPWLHIWTADHLLWSPVWNRCLWMECLGLTFENRARLSGLSNVVFHTKSWSWKLLKYIVINLWCTISRQLGYAWVPRKISLSSEFLCLECNK